MGCDFSRRVLDLADGLQDDEARAHLDACPACQRLHGDTLGVEQAKPEPRRVLDEPWWDLGIAPPREPLLYQALGLFDRAFKPTQQEHTLHFTENEVLRLEIWGISSEVVARRADARFFELQIDTTPDPGHQETDDSDNDCVLVLMGAAREPLLMIHLGNFYGYNDPTAGVRRSCGEVARAWNLPLRQVNR